MSIANLKSRNKIKYYKYSSRIVVSQCIYNFCCEIIRTRYGCEEQHCISCTNVL